MGTYKFRVLLDNTTGEDIFRDIKINQDSTFLEFFDIIIQAFYFRGDQMASFYVSNDSWDKGKEITLMDMGINEGPDAPIIMSETKIKDLVLSENQKFILVYDFLKMWIFLIELVDINNEEKIDAPKIEISIGISPDEDSKKIEMDTSFTDTSLELGDEFDDIFSEFGDEEGFGGFENIDDLDI
ncbi:MAG TPA: hypothetical protein EYG85_00125 [Crocinitomix sp.]|nr:hypothetical protein [Crocinitomix sp.]